MGELTGTASSQHCAPRELQGLWHATLSAEDCLTHRDPSQASELVRHRAEPLIKNFLAATTARHYGIASPAGTESPLIPPTLPVKAAKKPLCRRGQGETLQHDRASIYTPQGLPGQAGQLTALGRGMHPSTPCSGGLRKECGPPCSCLPCTGSSPSP